MTGFILRSQRNTSGVVRSGRVLIAMAVLGLCTGGVGVASAMDDIAVPGGVEGAAEVAAEGTAPCPQLTRLKYPFLTCSMPATGQVVLDPMGGSAPAEQIPPQSPFMNSLEYWGN